MLGQQGTSNKGFLREGSNAEMSANSANRPTGRAAGAPQRDLTATGARTQHDEGQRSGSNAGPSSSNDEVVAGGSDATMPTVSAVSTSRRVPGRAPRGQSATGAQAQHAAGLCSDGNGRSNSSHDHVADSNGPTSGAAGSTVVDSVVVVDGDSDGEMARKTMSRLHKNRKMTDS